MYDEEPTVSQFILCKNEEATDKKMPWSSAWILLQSFIRRHVASLCISIYRCLSVVLHAAVGVFENVTV
jgi:hypothetical protein